MAMIQQFEASLASSGTPLSTPASASPVTLNNSLTVWVAYAGTGSTAAAPTGLSVSGNGNAFAYQALVSSSANGGLALFTCQEAQAGTTTVQAAFPGYAITGVYAREDPTMAFVNFAGQIFSGGGMTGTDLNTSGTVTGATASSILMGFTWDQNNASVTPGAGTGFAGHTGVWAASVGSAVAPAICEDMSVSANAAATYSMVAGNRYDTFLTAGAIFTPITLSTLADGVSTVHSYALTGTSGAAMPAVTVGQVLDVLVMNNNSTATTCTVSDTLGNTYTAIDNVDYTSIGFQLFRFLCVVSAPGTPVITGQLGLIPANVAIAVAILPGINPGNPFTVGNIADNNQYPVTVGPNTQTSGPTPALAIEPATLGVWGLCTGFTNAPAAGSAFTQIGTAWGALGSSACLTYETQSLSSLAPVSGTFTPSVTNRAITMAAVFNQIPGPVNPAGPMPRRIFVLP
jgi:hypothetical protein